MSKYLNYTTIDDVILDDKFIPTDGWGANIVSHTYTNGEGQIIFDGDITAIPDNFCTNSSDKLNIKTIKIPDTVETIGDYVFRTSSYNTSDPLYLYEINLSECTKLSSIGNYFCSSAIIALECVDLSRCTSLKKIGTWMCSNNKNLKYLFLPDSNVSVNNYLCSNTPIEKIIFPKNLNSLGSSCFNNCNNMNEIVFTSDKAIDRYNFNNYFKMVPEDGVFKVPNGSDWKEKYTNPYKNWTMVEETEIDRIERGKEWIKYGIEYYGVTVPDDAKIDEYSKYIEGLDKSKVFISESVNGDKMTYLNHTMKLSGDIKTIYVSSESDWSTSESDTYHHISPTSGKAGEYIPVQISIPTVSSNVDYEFKFFTNGGYETIYKINQTK